jgi:hypothetical protein
MLLSKERGPERLGKGTVPDGCSPPVTGNPLFCCILDTSTSGEQAPDKHRHIWMPCELRGRRGGRSTRTSGSTAGVAPSTPLSSRHLASPPPPARSTSCPTIPAFFRNNGRGQQLRLPLQGKHAPLLAREAGGTDAGGDRSYSSATPASASRTCAAACFLILLNRAMGL